MDLAGLVSFTTIEAWVQFLFTHLTRDQPSGFSKVSLQQLVDCDKRLFILAAHQTMGRLRKGPDDTKPLDAVIASLQTSQEVLQYLSPLPAHKSHDPPVVPRNPKNPKIPKVAPKGGGKSQPSSGADEPSQGSKYKLPEGCVAFDDSNKPLCFGFQTGKCKFKGPPGKRCARGYHKCYKKGCYRLRAYMHCNHTD